MSIQSPEELLARYATRIGEVAAEVYAQKCRMLSREELFHLGVGGMLEAAQRFDPSLGTNFWAFVYPRVRGAMVDASRTMAPGPDHHRRLSAAEAALRATVAGTERHREAVQDLADATAALGRMNAESMALMRGEVLGVHDGLDRPFIRDEYEVEHDDLDEPSDDGSSRVMRNDAFDAYEGLEKAHLLAALHSAMGRLTLVERMILRGLYFEERGLVNEELGISKSWSSRIHTRALRRLKGMLERGWSEASEREAVEASTLVEGGDEVAANEVEVADRLLLSSAA